MSLWFLSKNLLQSTRPSLSRTGVSSASYASTEDTLSASRAGSVLISPFAELTAARVFVEVTVVCISNYLRT